MYNISEVVTVAVNYMWWFKKQNVCMNILSYSPTVKESE